MFHPVDSPQNYTGVGHQDRFGKGWADATGDARRRAGGPSASSTSSTSWLLRQADDRAAGVVPIAVVRKGLVNYGAATFEQPDFTTVGFTTKK